MYHYYDYKVTDNVLLKRADFHNRLRNGASVCLLRGETCGFKQIPHAESNTLQQYSLIQ